MILRVKMILLLKFIHVCIANVQDTCGAEHCQADREGWLKSLNVLSDCCLALPGEADNRITE